MKFVKYLFTVPEGEKVTDRHFRRVLISSVCSILLSMTCLVGTTWAWYTASIQTPAITLQMAKHHVELLDENNADLDNPLTVSPGTPCKVTAKFATDAEPDELNTAPCRILRLEIKPEGSADVKVLFVQPVKKDGVWLAQLELTTDIACTVSFYSQWEQPESEPLEPGVIKLIEGSVSQSEDETEGGNTEDEKTEGEETGENTPAPNEGENAEPTPGSGEGENAEPTPGTGEGEKAEPTPGTGEGENTTPDENTNSEDNTNP